MHDTAMLIKYLKIEKNETLIRYIRFKMGVNLIVDITPLDNQKDSGNNVGKTTVLRLVDYCLGGDAKTIYKDPEFKAVNSAVKDFLEENNVIITLCLRKSLDTSDGEILLRRNFLPRSQKLAEINGENFEIKEYRTRLNKLLFDLSSTQNPTFRQLIARFIRGDSTKMDKVIRYLHSSVTDNIYEGIYCFLFNRSSNASLSTEKDTLDRELNFNKKVVAKSFSNRTIEAIKQHLSLVDTDIKNLETQKRDFNVNPQYAKEYSELQDIKNTINNTTSNLSNTQFRLQLLIEGIEELKNQTSKIDGESLKMVYEEAKYYIPTLQKSFDDALAFHNKLITNKLAYLSEDIPTLKKEVTKLEEKLEQLLDKERELGSRLVTTGALVDYELIVSATNKKYEQKGRLEEELEKLQNLQTAMDKDNARIAEINTIINSTANELEDNITIFNQFFSTYSEKFYDEKFVLSAAFDNKANVYKFNISNVEGNLGDGKKKGLIAAFDLAYISYANSKGFNIPRFVMHDRIESIHSNQLKSLFDIVNSDQFNGQYIASVLSGKFSDLQITNNYLDDNKILELSQTNKLFKIESA
jgi:hypothetical protein